MPKQKKFVFPSNYEDLTEMQFEILKLSEFLLGTLGISGLQLKSISAKLEVAPSLINHYYKNTEELVFDTVLFSYSNLVKNIQSSNIHIKNPEIVARSWIKSMMDWTMTYPGIGVILEFPRQVLRSGSKSVDNSEKMLKVFLKEMSDIGASNVAFMASAVRALQKGTDFKVLTPVKVASLIAVDSKFAMYASMMGFSTIGAGLWIAGRRPADQKNPAWMKLGFDPVKQTQSTIENFMKVIKANK